MLTQNTQDKGISGSSRYVWIVWTRNGDGQAGDRPVDRGSFRAGAKSNGLLGKPNEIRSKQQPGKTQIDQRRRSGVMKDPLQTSEER